MHLSAVYPLVSAVQISADFPSHAPEAICDAARVALYQPNNNFYQLVSFRQALYNRSGI
jgi:hypothetical protein